MKPNLGNCLCGPTHGINLHLHLALVRLYFIWTQGATPNINIQEQARQYNKKNTPLLRCRWKVRPFHVKHPQVSISFVSIRLQRRDGFEVKF